MVLERPKTKAAQVRNFLKTPVYKRLGPKDAAARLNGVLDFPVNSKMVSNMRYQMEAKRKKKVVKSLPAPATKTRQNIKRVNANAYEASLTIPEGGLVLKLSYKKRAVGTLAIGSEGFIYMKVKGKKIPTRQIKWEHLARLFESGILG